jgi:hypothetical protein
LSRIITALFCFALLVADARAQTPLGAIEGTARDQSGGVLPGVAAVVSSPALIEGRRESVTDKDGTYSFSRLPVGTYTVTLTLPGFKTFVRTEIVINANFTATIHAELAVGELEESVTVRAESPLVDVRTTTGQTVITTEVMNAIPNSRNITDMLKFTLGASTSAPDVGGSTIYTYSPTKVHGSRPNDRSFYVDGMTANGMNAGGSDIILFSGASSREEVAYQTNAIPASVPYGGVVMSAVSKSGGDQFRGDLFADFQVAEADNLDDELKARGVRATSGVRGGKDVDGSFGGPIVRNRAWFLGAVRFNEITGRIANTFLIDGRQAEDYDRRGDYFTKVTVKVSDTARLAITSTRDTHYRPFRRDGASFVSDEAAKVNFYIPNFYGGYSLTGSLGKTWLYEVLGSFSNRGAPQRYRPEVGPDDVPHLDIQTSTLTVAATTPGDTEERIRMVNAAVMHVGEFLGSHEMKTGVQTNWGSFLWTYNRNGDIVLRYRNGVPDSVDLYNTPTDSLSTATNLALYFQDSWRPQSNLTVNWGLRYDEFRSAFPDQTSPAGNWVGERSFPGQEMPTFRRAVPRLGVAYDLMGDARTVIKASASIYNGNEGTGLANSQNPAGVASNRCTWTDSSGDLLAQAPEISRCAGFTGGVTSRLDPNLKRAFSREYSLGVERQLSEKFAASAYYYRRENRNLRATANVAVPYDSYIPIVITNPLDNTPLTIYNQDPATTGKQDNVLINSSALDDTYNGVEFLLERRFSADAYLQAGYHYGRDLGFVGTPGDLNDPNAYIFSNGAVGDDEPHQVKVACAYKLPWELTVSGFMQAYQGHPRQRSLQVGRALVPTLTRATQTVNLEPNDVNRYENVMMVDLRIGRRFRLGSTRWEAFVDMFNLLNANTPLTTVNTIGTSLGQVSETIRPRVTRAGFKLVF